MIRSLSLLLLASATLASAQETPLAPVASELASSFERPNGALMRPASLAYTLALHREAQITPLGTRTVTVAEAALAGVPGWVIAESRLGTAVATADTVYLARADLSPLRWVAAIGRSQLAASFTRDSMFGAVQSYQGRASFALPLPSDALLSAGMVERVIELLPLRADYRAAATLVLVDGTGPSAVRAEIVVVGEERLESGGRSVPCWLVALRAGAVEQRLWVSRDGSRVVRSEQATSAGLMVADLLP